MRQPSGQGDISEAGLCRNAQGKFSESSGSAGKGYQPGVQHLRSYR